MTYDNNAHVHCFPVKCEILCTFLEMFYESIFITSTCRTMSRVYNSYNISTLFGFQLSIDRLRNVPIYVRIIIIIIIILCSQTTFTCLIVNLLWENFWPAFARKVWTSFRHTPFRHHFGRTIIIIMICISLHGELVYAI